MELILPTLDDTPWPSLGGPLCDLLEERSVYGPGSLKGDPYKLDADKRFWLWRAYEIYPRGHHLAGRRRFQRVGISVRKGLAKTEGAAQIAWLELHPEAPVRFDGWDANGNPVGRPVRDPFIPMVSYTEEQTEELSYGALKYICEECKDNSYFDTGMDRILRIDFRGRPDGKAVALSGSPNARDGARTTFQHFDETHRMDLPRLVNAHETMLQNIPKRPLDDPWTLETTTAGQPGGNSIAETTHMEALAIERGEIENPTLCYFHREAGPKHKLDTVAHRIEGIREATGQVGEWGPGQFEQIARDYDRPKTDKPYWERVWYNRWTRSSQRAFDVHKFGLLAGPEWIIPKGSLVTLGFDGARFKDATGLVATDVVSGVQAVLGLWERPEFDATDWEVPEDEVNEVVEQAFLDFDVWRFYADPPHWYEPVGKWAGKWPDQVVEWFTHRRRPMSLAIRAYQDAINTDAVHHNGDARLVRHVGNAGRHETNLRDEDGEPVIILAKIKEELKFDLAMAAVLSWQARLDALAKGAAIGEEQFVPYRIR